MKEVFVVFDGSPPKEREPLNWIRFYLTAHPDDLRLCSSFPDVKVDLSNGDLSSGHCCVRRDPMATAYDKSSPPN